ncbi:FAD synthase [Metamycoplasma spumans]|uniref:FAD synthase n=1 Tax=Metamycoplasma spumans TaxID=92406 RepID=UPI00047F26D4
MKTYSWNFIDKLPIDDNLILCLGSFETLHLGHNQLFKLAKDLKTDNPDKKLAIILFKSPIKSGKIQQKKAFQTKTRLITLFELGFDYAFVIDVNEQIINLDYHVIINKFKENNVTDIVCGPDFKFGFNRQGTIEKLKKNFNVAIADERKVSKRKISSTLINELIEEGNISAINELLLQNYAFISNIENFEYKYPENLNQLKSGIYIVNAIIADYEYHGLTLINKDNQDNNKKALQNNILYLFDLEVIPSKYQEIYIEFLATIRYISNSYDNNLKDSDLNIAKEYFLSK